MKIKFLPILLVSLLVMMSAMTSCLDNDIEQVTYSSETSITSFSLGTLHVKRVGKDSKGEDSTYTDTISMANYPFTINQAMRTIENKDSLPVGTDISRVLTKSQLTLITFCMVKSIQKELKPKILSGLQAILSTLHLLQQKDFPSKFWLIAA